MHMVSSLEFFFLCGSISFFSFSFFFFDLFVMAWDVCLFGEERKRREGGECFVKVRFCSYEVPG